MAKRVVNHEQRAQLVAHYLAAYNNCHGCSDTARAVFNAIPLEDYRALQRGFFDVGVGIPGRRRLEKNFNGSSADLFFSHLKLGALRLEQQEQNPPAPQQ